MVTLMIDCRTKKVNSQRLNQSLAFGRYARHVSRSAAEGTVGASVGKRQDEAVGRKERKNKGLMGEKKREKSG